MTSSYDITCSCRKPALVTMDYDKATPTKAGPYSLSRRINRVCTTCWTHWFGPVGKVKKYTANAWDRWLEAA